MEVQFATDRGETWTAAISLVPLFITCAATCFFLFGFDEAENKMGRMHSFG